VTEETMTHHPARLTTTLSSFGINQNIGFDEFKPSGL